MGVAGIGAGGKGCWGKKKSAQRPPPKKCTAVNQIHLVDRPRQAVPAKVIVVVPARSPGRAKWAPDTGPPENSNVIERHAP